MTSASPEQYQSVVYKSYDRRIIPAYRSVQTIWSDRGTITAEHNVVYVRKGSNEISSETFHVNPDYL
jgi:hypothetical protein